MELTLYSFEHYEYADNVPLLFVALPHQICAIDIVAICRAVETMYGCTDQDTTDWALEFELWIRMLLHSNCLYINPRHLLLRSKAKEELIELLNGENRKIYQTALSSEFQMAALQWCAMKEGDEDSTLIVMPESTDRTEHTRYRVAEALSNAARIHGQQIEAVHVKLGRKYITDEHGCRYPLSEERVDENGNSFLLNYIMVPLSRPLSEKIS